MIPKIIHYCWFGRNKKPKVVRRCIESWQKLYPDFKLIEWNEKNTELNNPFCDYFLKKKKWAFVADYVRLDKLYKFGGVYLDTDMLMLKPLDHFLKDKMFFGAENDSFISGGIIGSRKEHFFIENCLRIYNSIDLKKMDNDLKNNTIPQIITQEFKKLSKVENWSFNELISYDGIKVYPKEYFYSLPFSDREKQNKIASYLTSNSYGVHLWNYSWAQHNEFHYFRAREYSRGMKMVLLGANTQPINLKYFLKILSCIKISLKSN